MEAMIFVKFALTLIIPSIVMLWASEFFESTKPFYAGLGLFVLSALSLYGAIVWKLWIG